jgi:hypothetical protein
VVAVGKLKNMRANPNWVGLASKIVAALALTILLAAHDAAVAQISLPFKLPPAANDWLKEVQPDALKQKATELAIRNLLDDQLPLRLDATTIYPTVAVLPGGPFKPTPLHLSAADMDSPLPPGDYTMQTLAFCMEYSVHQPGMGTAYVLAPLQGKAADAIGTLLWRGTLDMNKDRQQLQAVSWAIQSGLTYSQMPTPYQAVIDAVIPEYKGSPSTRARSAVISCNRSRGPTRRPRKAHTCRPSSSSSETWGSLASWR